MADNYPYTPGVGRTGASKDIGGVDFPRVLLSQNGTDVAAGTPLPTTLGTADPLLVAGTDSVRTITASITRPANATQYAIGEAIAATTPATGGSTFAGVVRAAGKGGILNDVMVISSNPAAIGLQADLVLFDSAVTAIADNATYVITDAEAATLVGVVPFVLVADNANNSRGHAQNVNIAFTTVGGTDLRFLVRTSNAYTPISGEVLTFRGKFVPVG